jgi:predicted Rdx family selenoprotein
MEPKKQYKISYTMSKADIMTFVSGLHDVQMDMIETVVQRKEREGFPEATVLIKHIMELK